MEMDVTEHEEGHGGQAAWEREIPPPFDLPSFVRMLDLASSCPATPLHHLQISQGLRYLEHYIRQIIFVYITLSFSQALTSPSS